MRVGRLYCIRLSNGKDLPWKLTFKILGSNIIGIGGKYATNFATIQVGLMKSATCSWNYTILSKEK